MTNKKGLEFSFAWMFAIIAGAAIIFLAIYGTTKLIGSEREVSSAEVGAKLSVLLNPAETGVESAKISKIVFPVRTRIYNTCEPEGIFGAQKLSISQESGLGKKWDEPGVAATSYNKYVFSENVVEGKEFVLFSKPFEMPFKAADMIFIWSSEKRYCFIGAPATISDEIRALGPQNINLTDNVKECEKASVKVCFSISNCDIDVSMSADEMSGSVKKGFDSVYYEGALVYGAIFSSKDVYECQVQRLMKRTSELAGLYAAKSLYSSGKGCESSGVGIDLLVYANMTQIEDSSKLRAVASKAEEIGRENENLQCRLF